MDYFKQESERLTYRAITEKDIDTWLEFFENNDSLHFLGIDTTKDHNTIATEWILKQLERYKNDGFGHLAVIEKASGELIGMTGILKRDLDGNEVLEIAYSLKPKHWNKGYATEMARQMKQFGIQTNMAKSFVSIIHKNNAASINVAKKNDMSLRSETQFLGMEVFIYGDQ
jgi:ribosomal-protein-alanine N-acetyltransferase